MVTYLAELQSLSNIEALLEQVGRAPHLHEQGVMRARINMLIGLLHAVGWLSASFWSSCTRRQISPTETWIYRAALIAGGIMLAPWSAWMLGEAPLWTMNPCGGAPLWIAMLAGLFVTWWARMHLGRLWSGAISIITSLARAPTLLRPSHLHRACHRFAGDRNGRSNHPSARRRCRHDLRLLAESPR